MEYVAGAPESDNDNNIKDYLEESLKLQQQAGPDETSSAVMASTAVPTKSASDVKVSRSSTMPGFSKRIVNEPEVNKRPQTSSAKRKEKRRKRDAQLIMYEKSSTVPDSLAAFTDEIHEIERITPAEEVTLGCKTQELIRLENLYSFLEDQLDRAPTDDEWCAAAGKINITCLQQCLDEGKAAKDKLVVSNLRMVQRVVNLYIRNGLGSEYNAGDMMQEGTLALIRAAEKFEPTRGFRFSTYAMYWIRASVKRSQMAQSRIISVPQRVHETYKRLIKVESELALDLKREPTDEEIATALKVTLKQLDNARKAMNQSVFSLDKTLVNGKTPSKSTRDTNMYELIPDEESMQYANDATIREELINSLRRHLTPIEVKVLCLRYGLLESKRLPPGYAGPLTIKEVGLLVGLKPDKIRRTINKSLRQLKYLIAHEWPDYSQEVLIEMRSEDIHV